MRTFTAAVLASSMLVSSAFAADTAPLAPGKPAGTQQAQGIGGLILPGIVGAVVIGLVAYTITYKNKGPANNSALSTPGTATP